ncbi:Outer membrane protein beta-barrel domain-containing protein [Flexibacter flexilis DSM 6793]|uniref:Outer membrane protein beta-barrel domain-containing protein n=1 Tax=Flexibacter flexilis DSM 6793 TaxID=927664 RepID=A0A1I1DF28_9BACT|nr:outer membrane beta-barrel protein [Flexibacter flexilis]SFB73565.1 Outer membrane protein beta-barrel domain-containing protein [Flexibacter flexilis DSM 6793]
MKKTLCALGLLLASSCLATAQTEKGTKAIGGGFNISTNNFKDNNNSNRKSKGFDLSILPTAEYFIANNLSIKAQLGVGYSKYTNEYMSYSAYSTKNKSNNLSAGAYVRKYIPVIDKKLFVFVDAGLNYGYTKKNTQYNDSYFGSYETDVKINQYSVGAYSGIAYFISPKFGIESSLLKLEYSHSNDKTTNTNTPTPENTTTSTLGLGLVSGLNLTLKYYFK